MAKLKGFFSKTELSDLRGTSIHSLSEAEPNCGKCKLYEGCRSPQMEPTGEGRRQVLIIAEAPGRQEDEQGEQLVGEVGQFLSKRLKKLGLDLRKDFWKINAINCRPPGNRTPKATEIDSCKPMVDAAIRKFQPKFIWLLGGLAMDSFYRGRFTNNKVNRWRGYVIPDRYTGAWVLPQFHPSAGHRATDKRDYNLLSVYDRDLKQAVECLDYDPPKFDQPEKCVEVLTNFSDIIRVLRKALNHQGPIIIDYETTSLVTRRPGCKVVSISLSMSPDKAYSFPYKYRSLFSEKQLNKIGKLWSKLVKKAHVGAQNAMFEDSWCRFEFDAIPKNWGWCTMIATHMLDDRHNITSLDFQSYKRWGIENYDSEVAKYKRNRPGSYLNRIEEADLEDLLLYGGMDSLLTYRLYEEQLKEFEPHIPLQKARKFFHEGMIELMDIRDGGIHADGEYMKEVNRRLGEKIERLKSKIRKSEEAELFEEKVGRGLKTKTEVSDDDLRTLFYDIQGYEPLARTESGLASVDTHSLDEIGTPFAKSVKRLRKLNITRSRYLGQYMRAEYDGKMYPFVNLHTARSFRSSYSNPSFQNVPVRDEYSMKTIRSAFIAPPDHYILSTDYGGIEVCVAACYSDDPNLIHYIRTPGTDMHRDEAMNIFYLDEKQVGYWLRFYAKNGFVFPEFYGDWYMACARNIWENCAMLETEDGIKIIDHFKEIGMISKTSSPLETPKGFIDHMKTVEDEFWKKYGKLREWQERNGEFYREHGYVELFHGFRRGGYLEPKKIGNTPIQGTAFHILFWSLIQLNRIRRRRGWTSRIFGQIHDEILWYLHKDEKHKIPTVIEKVMVEMAMNEHPWINVPLSIDFEMSPLEGNWAQMNKINKEDI